MSALLDMGSEVTVLSEEFYNTLPNKPQLTECVILKMAGHQEVTGHVAIEMLQFFKR